MDPDGAIPRGGSAPGALGHVVELQKDGLVLLRHLAETHRFGGGAAGPGAEIGPEIFIADPAAVASDPKRFCHLLQSVHALTRAAAPATAASIRITAGYVHGEGHPTGYGRADPPDAGPGAAAALAMQVKGRRLRAWFRFLKLCTLAGALATLLAMVHLDNGRRVIEQHRGASEALRESYVELAKLTPLGEHFRDARYSDDGTRHSELTPDASLLDATYCWPADPGKAGEDTYRLPISDRARTLCGALHQQQIREALIFARLETWNCINHRISYWNPLEWRVAAGGAEAQGGTGDAAAARAGCPALNVPLQPPAKVGDWRRTELYTQDGITHLAGYLLPLLLGGLGAAVSTLRNAEAKVAASTLRAYDGIFGFLRILMATILGGLLGLLFGHSSDVQVGTYTLSLAALAFLVGYALDRVLQTLDLLIDKTIGQVAPKGGGGAAAEAAVELRPAGEVRAGGPRTEA